MTKIILKHQVGEQELPFDEWYFIKGNLKGKESCLVRLAVRMNMHGDRVYYVNNCGLSYDTYENFEKFYNVVGPANTIEAY